MAENFSHFCIISLRAVECEKVCIAVTFCDAVKKFYGLTEEIILNFMKHHQIEKKLMSMASLELLTCGKLLRIYFAIKFCHLPAFLFISGHVPQ